MNACESCPFGPAVTDAAASLETFSRELVIRSDKAWDLALQIRTAAEAFNESIDDPAATAKVDQTQSHILDTTARLNRVSHEVQTLLEVTFERAEAIDCPENNAETAIHCPKMDTMLEAQPVLDTILEDLPRSH